MRDGQGERDTDCGRQMDKDLNSDRWEGTEGQGSTDRERNMDREQDRDKDQDRGTKPSNVTLQNRKLRLSIVRF